MLVLKGNSCIFLFPPAIPTSYSILMHSNVSIALRVKRCLCKKHLLCLSAPSALFLLGTLVCKGTGQEEDARRHHLEGLGRMMLLRKEQDLLSWWGPGAPGRWGCFAGMCFFRDKCANGRGCLVLSAACGKRWFVSLYWWIIFQYDSRRWPSDQLHKLQELCPPSFLHPLLWHILHRLLKCLAVPKSHLCSNICFDHHKWQIIPHGYLSWMILPEFTLWS